MKERKRQTVFPLPRSPFFRFHEVGRNKFIFPSVVGATLAHLFVFLVLALFFSLFQIKAKRRWDIFILFYLLS